MKKIILTLVVALFATFMVSAQTVQEQQVTFDKVQVTAYTIATPDYTPELIYGAIQQKWEKNMGLKVSKYAGYKAYLAQQFPTISTQNLDVYIKAEQTGKKKEKTTLVTMLVSTGNNNFITPANNPEAAANIKTALTELIAYVAEYSKTQNITANTNTINKLKEEQKKLEGNKEKLQKEMNDLDKKIKDKQVEIDKLQQENEKLQK